MLFRSFNVVSFNVGNNIIKVGEFAALSKLTILRSLSSKIPNINQQINLKPIDSITINIAKVSGNKNYTRAYILGKLKLKSNKKISYKDFSKGVNNLVATNNFDAFEYELKDSPNKEGYDLLASVKETQVNTFLKLGLHYDDLYKSAALINLTKKQLFFKNDVGSLDIILGDNVRYNFEYLIDNGFHWSI